MESHNWCYTANNYSLTLLGQLYGLYENEYCTYHVMGFELAPETGTPHIQGYFNTKSSKTFKVLHNKFPSIHLEMMRGTPQEASIYCKKGGDYIEQGILPDRGSPKVTTLQVMLSIREGHSKSELRQLYPSFCLYHQSKIDQWFIEEQKQQHNQMEFYVLNEDDPITGIIDTFTLDDTPPKLAVIHELYEIEDYSDFDTVLYIPGYFESKHNLWPRGVNITYKNGYQVKHISCKRFIISTSYMQLYDKKLWHIGLPE